MADNSYQQNRGRGRGRGQERGRSSGGNGQQQGQWRGSYNQGYSRNNNQSSEQQYAGRGQNPRFQQSGQYRGSGDSRGYNDRGGYQHGRGQRPDQGYNRGSDRGRGRGNRGSGNSERPRQEDSRMTDELCRQFSQLDIEPKNPFTYKMSDSSINQMLSADKVKMLKPYRYEPATDGTKIELNTNYFSINNFNGKKIEYYEVTIKLKKGDGEETSHETPEKANIEDVTKSKDRNVDRMNKDEKRTLINQFIERIAVQFNLSKQAFVYDGSKSLYVFGQISTQMDESNSTSQDILYRNEIYSISITKVETVDLGFLLKYLEADLRCKEDSVMAVRKFKGNGKIEDFVDEERDKVQKCFQVIDVVLRHTLCQRISCYGRSYFNLSGEAVQLNNSKFLYQGFFANFRFCFGRLALNLDVANGVFIKEQSVQNYLTTEGVELFNWRNDHVFNRANSLLKGLRVKLTHFEYPRYTKITGLVKMSASEHRFNVDNSRTVTVQQYYREKYNIECQPDLPLLLGSKQGTYFPLDVCVIPFTRLTGQDQEGLASSIIKQTALNAVARKQLIISKLKGMLGTEMDPYLQEWGIKINPQMEKITGLVIQFPDLQYSPKCISSEGAKNGVLTLDSNTWRVSNKFLIPPRAIRTPIRWACFNLSRISDQEVQNFFDEVVKVAITYGVPFEPQGNYYTIPPKTVISTIHQLLLRNEHELLFFVNPNSTDIYGSIKSVTELQFGIITQFVKDTTVRNRLSSQVVFNVCYKLNPKLGGVNLSMSKTPRPATFDVLKGQFPETMFVGIDVTHNVIRGPKGSSRISIAAVVASMDFHPSHYEVSLCCQKHLSEGRRSLEIIADMKRIMLELLEKYHKRNGRYPARIFVYRDGVSEGQFKTVINYEFAAMDAAVRTLMPDKTKCLETNDPRGFITYCIVQKRHHTRFFMKKSEKEIFNVNPGTLVDSAICMATEFDFFLCSHSCPKGTARPTYYRVLIDENRLSRLTMSKITFSLCFTNCRCTIPVSVPAPCYYAHHAAFRARHYVDYFTTTCGDAKLSEFVFEQKRKEREKAGQKSPNFVNIASIVVNPQMNKYLFFV